MKNTIHSTEIYKSRAIGIFFLLAFLAYGIGRNLFESTGFTEKYTGAILIIANSVMVFIIGVHLRKTLQQYNMLAGNIYLFARVFESIALVSLVLNLKQGVNIPDYYGYFPAMIVLGLGSIPMCFIFYKYKISPSWLAIWGVIGYCTFAFGFLMELFGREWSMYFLTPGALWEVTFAIWLIIKGGQKTKKI